MEFQGIFDFMRSKKGICFKAVDIFSKFLKAKPATFLPYKDSKSMADDQSSTKQRNDVMSRLDPINKSRLSERDFVDDGCRQRMNCVVLVV